MNEENKDGNFPSHTKCDCKHHHKQYSGSNSQAIYGFGLIGALVYYLQNAVGANAILWGIIKAIGWPAVVVYKVLEMWQL